MEIKKIQCSSFCWWQKNSGAFKGANILHKDLIKNNINSSMIYEKDDTKLNSIKSKIRKSIEKLPKIFYPMRKELLSVLQL